MTWTRPDHVPFPNVWERFQGKILVNGKPLQYRIQDITEDLVDPIIAHMTRYFLIREACNSHDGLIEDEISLKEIQNIWKHLLEQKMGLVAIVEGDEEESKRIAGVNVVSVSQKTDPKKTAEGKRLRRLIKVLDAFYEKEDLFKKFGVDKYLNGMGLSVAPQYQGDNVGYYLLKARTPLCQACGIPLTITLFSNPAATHEAVKDGFQILTAISSNEFTIDNAIVYPRLKPIVFSMTAKVIPIVQNK